MKREHRCQDARAKSKGRYTPGSRREKSSDVKKRVENVNIYACKIHNANKVGTLSLVPKEKQLS